ncbi:MAG TPA: SGNH/GDSL hydrolase family protein [Caulifigura sp.]|jgi:acyl-CoA thioesterase-1|nr:SGNH/GDSL hydrolase family protein [Caulifigura sp.]
MLRRPVLFGLLLLAASPAFAQKDEPAAQAPVKEEIRRPTTPAKPGAEKPADASQPAARANRPPNPAMEKVTDDPALPRVLIIGDSISIGYTAPLRAALKGKANLHRALENCGPSTRGVASIDKWLATGGSEKWDVIQFNFGLHDIRHFKDGKGVGVTEGERQVLEADYEKNLRTIVARLKQTGAKLIWRNTTPVPEGSGGRVPGDEVRYNEIAKKIMDENQIPIDDMYAYCLPRLKEIQRPANVHFTEDGSKALADYTAQMILAALSKPTAQK